MVVKQLEIAIKKNHAIWWVIRLTIFFLLQILKRKSKILSDSFFKIKEKLYIQTKFLLRGIWNTDKYSVAHMCMEIPYRVLQYLSHLKLDFANQLLDLAIDVLVSK